jgi:hypothetical protein
MKIKQFSFLVTLVLFCVSIKSFANECHNENKCIFVIGNSITRHLSKPDIGWHGHWGMAATREKNDYVGKLVEKLNQGFNKGHWQAVRFNGLALERDAQQPVLTDREIEFARSAQIVVVQLGDNFEVANFHKDPSAVNAFSTAYSDLLTRLKPSAGSLVCISTWWASAQKDQIIKQRCTQANGIFVDISGLFNVSANIAGNERVISHRGVAAHPGDLGMNHIADRIYKVLPKS